MARFKYEKLAKYPHMKPYDVEVWERFMELNPNMFDGVDYDVCVGEGADFLPTGEDTPDGRENRLYQKKIDVVGYKNGDVWLIEVKPEGNASALGQILTYAELWMKSGKTPRYVTMAVVCKTAAKELEAVYLKHGVILLSMDGF